jgi:hypothetical protein
VQLSVILIIPARIGRINFFERFFIDLIVNLSL